MAEGQRSVQEILQFLTTEHFTLVPAVIGVAALVISWLALDTLSTRGFRRRIREVDVAFPASDRPEPSGG